METSRLYNSFDEIERMIASLRHLGDELASSLEFTQSVLNSIGEPLVVLDASLKVLTANRHFYSMFMTLPKETEQRSFFELGYPQWDVDEFRIRLRKVLSENEPVEGYEIRDDFPGLGDRILSFSANKMYKGINQPDAIVLIIRDVTDQRALEQAREDVERIARHDLRSPISGAISLLTVLIEEAKDEDGYIGLVKHSLNALKHAIGALDISMEMLRIELGTFQVTPDSVDVPNLISDIFEELSSTIRYKNIHVLLECAREECELHDYYVCGLSSIMHSIYGNIIRNAVEASPKGGSIKISLTPRGQMLEFVCRNEGDVPEYIRERFFDKYVTAEKSGGSGLGTYVAKRLVQAHAGNIFMRTGNGSTTLTVNLPTNACPIAPVG